METHNNIRIFLVDDDSFCINLYKQYLNSLGYFNITTFENGPDCLNSLSFKPNVIFLDHGMDYLTGLEVLKKNKGLQSGNFCGFPYRATKHYDGSKSLKVRGNRIYS